MKKKILYAIANASKSLERKSGLKIPFSNLFRKYIMRLTGGFPEFIQVMGHDMYLDSLDSLSLSTMDSFEEVETDMVKKIIKKGDIVLDLGANIGYYTLIFAKLVGNNGKVYAFEPEPNNFKLLKKNIEINGYENVVLVKKAVSNKTGKTKLYLSDVNMGDHMVVDPGQNRQSIQIETIQIDDFFLNFDRGINFIKMDIQGSEMNAIKGMNNILKQSDDVKIMLEFAPKWIKRFGYEPKQLLEVLTELDFKIFEFDNKKKKIFPTDIQKLIKKYPVKQEKFTDLLCIK